MSKLLTNTTDLQEVLQTLQTKAAGAVLPELTNEGSASDLLSGEQLIDSKGKVIVGTMPNNGMIISTMDGINTKSVAIPQGYTSGGTVSLDNTIDNEVNTQANLISQIVNALENKAVEVEYKEVEWSENENAMITGTLSSYFNDKVKSINRYAFHYHTSLTTVNFPVVTTVDASAFDNCQKLTSVSFPACTYIGNDAFRHCYSLTSVSFPTCTSIGYGAFDNCSKLTTANFPVCTSMGNDAFNYCCSLTSVNFPVCTSLDRRTFRMCNNLTSVNFPACTNISDYAFYSCYSLTSISFPSCTTIGNYAFNRCYNLKSLYLTGSSLCKLSNSNAFSYTPIGGYSTSTGTYGSIYVPASLLTSYQTATNWTYFSSRFVGI